MKSKNITKLACIVNTDGCHGPGMHWVSLYIDIEQGQVILFNSVPAKEYNKELQVVKKYCELLAKEVSEVSGKQVQAQILEGDYQVKPNTCGVFAISFILAKVLGADTQKMLKYLENDRKEEFTDLVKRMLFG